MSQLAIPEAGPEPDRALAQWHTSPKLAAELVALAGALLDDARRRGFVLRVLEPSAGSGNLVRAVLDRCPRAHVDAVEVDVRWRAALKSIHPEPHVETVDYLRRAEPTKPYDLGVTNPPYDGGEEVDHLEKMLAECSRIVALLPARSLHGRERYRRLWSRFDPRNPSRNWWIHRKVNCVARPSFSDEGGKDEIVLLDMRRSPGPDVEAWL